MRSVDYELFFIYAIICLFIVAVFVVVLIAKKILESQKRILMQLQMYDEIMRQSESHLHTIDNDMYFITERLIGGNNGST